MLIAAILLLIGVLLAIGTPLFATIGLSAVLQFLRTGIDPTVVVVELYRIASAPTLLAIPLFTFAGYVLAESQAPRRLFELAESMLGWMPGGVAIVSLVTCALFTCFTGASGVTIIAIGGLIYPILIKQNYTEEFSLGLITSSGSLGLLFPPSLPMILFGIMASVSIDDMFVAGILPGIFLILVLSVYAIRHDVSHRTRAVAFSWKRILRAFWQAKWEIPIPVIILGGIYGGFITVVEASAVSAFYVLVAEFGLNRDLTLQRNLIPVLRDSVQLVGGILIILTSSMGLTAFFIDAQIPQMALLAIKSVISSKFTFLLLLNCFLLIIGALLDIFSAIIIVVPMIIPIAVSYGIDPVHLGIIFLTNLEIGYLTPPIGLNLFIASFRFKKSILYLYRVSLPFFFILLAALMVITYFPWLSLVLLQLIR